MLRRQPFVPRTVCWIHVPEEGVTVAHGLDEMSGCWHPLLVGGWVGGGWVLAVGGWLLVGGWIVAVGGCKVVDGL